METEAPILVLEVENLEDWQNWREEAIRIQLKGLLKHRAVAGVMPSSDCVVRAESLAHSRCSPSALGAKG